ncbi:MAG: outer membrane beta-barrel protein [Deltaproteobacteria bacterium]
MKNLIFSFFFLLFSLNIVAQNEFGFKAGLSSYDLASRHIGSTSDLKLSLKDSRYGFHGGIYGRLGLMGIYIQPELIFNTNKVDYKLKNINTADSIEEIRTTRYQNIDLPVLIMIAPSIFKIYAGPVGHYFLNSFSDINEKHEIKEEFSKIRYGYQLGAGVTLKGLTIDIRYEGNFSKYYKTFSIDGQQFKTDESPSRLLISLWFNIF